MTVNAGMSGVADVVAIRGAIQARGLLWHEKMLQSLPHLAGLPRYTVTVETAPVVG